MPSVWLKRSLTQRMILAAALLLQAMIHLPCVAQEVADERTTAPPPAEAAEEPATTEQAVDDKQVDRAAVPPPAGPDTTIWIDDDGTPRPVIGLSYEELTRAWRLLKGLETPVTTPRYLREHFQATGIVETDYIKLSVTLKIKLLSEGRIEVPLGLAGTVLSDLPIIKGESGLSADSDQQVAAPKAEFITYDSKQGGFIAWLAGRSGQSRLIEMPLLVPLVQENAQTLMRLNIPRATQSLLTVETASAVANPFASEGVLLETEPNDNSGTKIRASGTVGEVQIGWQTPTPVPAKQRSVLSVAGQIFTDIDGRSVRSVANLEVSSYGGQVERFRVELPAGATLIPSASSSGTSRSGATTSSGPRVSLMSDISQAANSTEGSEKRPICLVTLPEKSAGPVNVQIITEQALLPDDPLVDLAGFQVIGALRQYGDMAIRVADDWRLRWGEQSEGARRIATSSLPESLQRSGVTTAVRYYRQPWHLPVRVMLLGSRVEATPEYRLEIRPDEAILTTKITYQIPGARVPGFSIDLKDWTKLTPDPIGPVGLVDGDQITQTREGILYVPFKQPTARRAEVTFIARKDLSVSSNLLELQLPVPVASVQKTSSLVVVVDPSLQLIPNLAKSRHLRAVPLGLDERDSADPDGMRTFQFRGFLPDQTFAANKRGRAGRIDLQAESQVLLAQDRTLVSQDFNFDVQYQPVDQISFIATGHILSNGMAKFELLPAKTVVPSPAGQTDGESEEKITATSDTDSLALPLQYRVIGPSSAFPDNPEGVPLPDSGAQFAAGQPIRFVVDLPRPWLGAFCIRASYELPAQLSGESNAKALNIALIEPQGSRVLSNTAAIRSDESTSLSLSESERAWSTQNDLDSTQAGLRVSASGSPRNISITHSPRRDLQNGKVVLKRSWFQTWLRGEKVQQRAAFVLQTTARTIRLQLPETVGTSDLEVLVNGKWNPAVRPNNTTLLVELPQQERDEQRIEIRYFELASQFVEAVDWKPVRVVAESGWAQNYWEVVLPTTRHAATTPQNMVGAMHWQPVMGLWQRQPALSTSEVTAWAGAATGSIMPTTAENRYLYSWYGPFPEDRSNAISILARENFVVASSALLLTLGLLLVYAPILREPWCLLLLALACISIAAVFPNAFVTIAQAGFLGLLLAGLAATLKLLLQRPSSAGAADMNSSLTTEMQAGGETIITLPISSVSSNAPTVSVAAGESHE